MPPCDTGTSPSRLPLDARLCNRSLRRDEGTPMLTPAEPSPAEPAGGLPAEVDVVVIGAGHNGLVAAGYLAAAGLEVCVLEAGAAPGGDTITEELTLPGFAHDSCSSAHVLIQSNPLLRDDELALLSKHGLE